MAALWTANALSVGEQGSPGSDRVEAAGKPSDWLISSPPAIAKLFGHKRIGILKMDCEVDLLAWL